MHLLVSKTKETAHDVVKNGTSCVDLHVAKRQGRSNSVHNIVQEK